MATAGQTIRALLDQSRDLERRAQRLQGARELHADDGEVDALVADYQAWLARAVAVLPTEFEARFRSEYEGNWHSNKIRDFLAAPGQPSPFWKEDEPDSPFPFWSHPYESTFKVPLLNQRQILAEAREQLEGAGSASQDLDMLERLARRFPDFLVPLAHRGRNRPPFIVEDEYDVQIALHAILRLFFDDVRAEDFSPERAGARSRVDFLLKTERIVVETKMTRSGLGPKEIGEELIVDIERYKSHPDCGALVALVYDPETRIANRRGLEQDLTRTHDGLVVRVFVVR